MKVVFTNGEFREVPINVCTGYSDVKSIVLSADDVFQLRMYLQRNPRELRAILSQLEARFEERRVEFANAAPKI